MNSLYDLNSLEELTKRINTLNPETQKKWGTMDTAQMFSHCSDAMKMANGTTNLKRLFISYIIGKLLKPSYSNDKPYKQNLPTAKEFVKKEAKNFDQEKGLLISLISDFQKGGEEKCTTHPHPMFGKLTTEEWGKGCYKHLDHHLRQFGV